MLPSSATTGAASAGETHQRSKSSVLRSFMGGHKRGNSDGTNLPSAFTTPIATTPDYYVSEQNLTINRDGVYHVGWEPASPALSTSATMAPPPSRHPQLYNSYNALGELQQNRQERSSERPRGRVRDQYPPPISSQKGTGTFSTVSLKPAAPKDPSGKSSRWKEESPKKAKSATNLSGLLRPKSMKNLKEGSGDQQQDNQAARAAKDKDKENRTPPNSLGDGSMGQAPPIYAQFTNQLSTSPPVELPIRNGGRPEREGSYYPPIVERPSSYRRPRPKSFTDYVTSGFNRVREKSRERERERSVEPNDDNDSGLRRGVKKLTWGRKNASNPGLRTKTSAPTVGVSGSGSNNNIVNSAPPPTPTVPAIEMPVIDPKDIDTHLEAMLDRRNIPENQRYKMRNLSNTIKLEFIRQDWAETQAKKQQQQQQQQAEAAASSGSLAVPTNDSGNGRRSMDVSRPWVSAGGAESGAEDDGSGNSPKKKKHGRGLSLTIMKGSHGKTASALNSPAKKKGDGTSLGRHFRTKSSESLVQPDTPQPGASFAGNGGYTSNLINKVKGQQMPGDFVAYLRKVQQPQAVEVGKLHKLRLLLRNETVAWIEEFIRQSGMKEIVELLHRIMALEWREEHEDALLHEVLLCLKALCTTDMALQYLHSIHTTLFPALLHMIFDPEKKGPSEFTTRGIITSILFTYIECATPQERLSRAKAVLGFLRDPEPEGDKRPLDFVLEMRRERPYRVWCKEVVCVTKEVFWIFLHNLNIVALPGASDSDPTNPAPPRRRSNTSTSSSLPLDSEASSAQFAYMARHFPQERPPVPAAPYVGGVEWDATNYLASHLDLMNAILACTGPTAAERNALRGHMRISGWERCLGGSLRMCKEKFYGAVHDGLRTWVAAAYEDGWDVRDVRFGPPPESKSRSQSPVKRAPGAGKKEAPIVPAAPPKLEMPKFDFGVGVGGGIPEVGSRVSSGAYGAYGAGAGSGLSSPGVLPPGGNGLGGNGGGGGSGRSRRDVYPRSPSHEGGGLWLS